MELIVHQGILIVHQGILMSAEGTRDLFFWLATHYRTQSDTSLCFHWLEFLLADKKCCQLNACGVFGNETFSPQFVDTCSVRQMT